MVGMKNDNPSSLGIRKRRPTELVKMHSEKVGNYIKDYIVEKRNLGDFPSIVLPKIKGNHRFNSIENSCNFYLLLTF